MAKADTLPPGVLAKWESAGTPAARFRAQNSIASFFDMACDI